MNSLRHVVWATKFILILLSFLAWSETGRAADLAPSAPPPKPFSWTGFYLGANVGFAWGKGNVDFLGQDAPALNSDPSGFVIGPQIGFNWQVVGGFVVGFELDATWANLKESFSVEPVTSNIFVNTLGWHGTGRLRLGYAAGNILVYATGGGAWAINRIGFDPPTSDVHRYHVGWTVGAGVEYGITSNWSAKIEYLYVDLGKQAIEFVFNGPTAFDSAITISTLRAGLNFRF